MVQSEVKATGMRIKETGLRLFGFHLVPLFLNKVNVKEKLDFRLNND